MINISDWIATVEGKVGIKKKIDTNCTEEELEGKKSVNINNYRFFQPVRNSLLDPAIVVMDLDQLTQDTPYVESDNVR